MMLKGIKVRLDPTPSQERMLLSHAGAARFAYNFMLGMVKAAIAGRVGWFVWSKAQLRRVWNSWKPEVAPWSAGNSKEAYSYGVECLANALKNWADSKNGKRKGRKVGFPKYRTRSRHMKFAYTTGSFGLIKGDPKALKLPRIGRVHCFEDMEKRVGDGRVLRMTVSYCAGAWYASLTVEYPDPVVAKKTDGGTVGIDLGIKTLATCSDGTVIDNPKHYKRNERKLRKASKRLSRRVQGSNRWKKALLAVQKAQAKTAAQRQDAINHATTMIATTYDTIVIEDLNVAGMKRNRHLAKAISDAAFGEFRRQLAYKCLNSGATLIVADRWYPSSKTCSRCGTVKAKLSLADRVFVCDNLSCDYAREGVDRDWNAAVNLEHYVAPSAVGDAKRARRNRKTTSPQQAGNAGPVETRTKQNSLMAVS
ncbi:IS607 family element RNA-guided endonuclease TnpB [Bifidobacterium gallicum]|uniref:Transposase, IS605 OrfB family n=2 Tax=Bifidobacterium gallicum DSM 20093 = LMG 11596 TaxID=561180 RepID=D1NTF5_9BIFI|nr:IS607 family element RNA-guided endonuclease TnpB [Bifidobacterium gallicum]EFA23009.1 transposase, IS605 OrfB family [Bifidobacterium gallicum DSM 20093 = LMG 11596]